MPQMQTHPTFVNLDSGWGSLLSFTALLPPWGTHLLFPPCTLCFVQDGSCWFSCWIVAGLLEDPLSSSPSPVCSLWFSGEDEMKKY